MTVLTNQQRERLERIADEYATGPDRRIPGLVFGAVRDDGKPFFKYATGNAGIASDRAMTLDTTFWVASFTKLLTSISAMILIERGNITLDDADVVEEICPELAAVKVLTRNGNGRFELVDKKRRITFRMLLNHTGMKLEIRK